MANLIIFIVFVKIISENKLFIHSIEIYSKKSLNFVVFQKIELTL